MGVVYCQAAVFCTRAGLHVSRENVQLQRGQPPMALEERERDNTVLAKNNNKFSEVININ